MKDFFQNFWMLVTILIPGIFFYGLFLLLTGLLKLQMSKYVFDYKIDDHFASIASFITLSLLLYVITNSIELWMRKRRLYWIQDYLFTMECISTDADTDKRLLKFIKKEVFKDINIKKAKIQPDVSDKYHFTITWEDKCGLDLSLVDAASDDKARFQFLDKVYMKTHMHFEYRYPESCGNQPLFLKIIHKLLQIAVKKCILIDNYEIYVQKIYDKTQIHHRNCLHREAFDRKDEVFATIEADKDTKLERVIALYYMNHSIFIGLIINMLIIAVCTCMGITNPSTSIVVMAGLALMSTISYSYTNYMNLQAGKALSTKCINFTNIKIPDGL